MKPYTITRGVTDEDLDFLLQNISKKDAIECSFQCLPLSDSMREMLDAATETVSIHRNGVLTNIGGVQGMNEDMAVCWMLKTDYARCETKEERGRQRATLDKVIQMLHDLTSYKTVVNKVWQEQKIDVKWLPSVGFTLLKDNKILKLNPDGDVGIFIPIIYEVNRGEEG